MHGQVNQNLVLQQLPLTCSIFSFLSCLKILYDLLTCYVYLWGFPGSSDSKESAYNEGDPGSIPGKILEKGMAAHSTEESGGLQSHGVAKSQI